MASQSKIKELDKILHRPRAMRFYTCQGSSEPRLFREIPCEEGEVDVKFMCEDEIAADMKIGFFLNARKYRHEQRR